MRYRKGVGKCVKLLIKQVIKLFDGKFWKFDRIEFSICANHQTSLVWSKHSNHLWSIHSKKFKMATGDIVMLVVLNELVDSDDETPHRGKTRDWIKRRKEKGYFNNIVKELKIEDRFGFLSFLLFAFFVCSAFCLTNKSPFLSQLLHFLRKTFLTPLTSISMMERNTENAWKKIL